MIKLNDWIFFILWTRCDYVPQADLDLCDPSASVSCMLGLQDCPTVTTPWIVCSCWSFCLEGWHKLGATDDLGLCPSYKNYCVGSCHPQTENRLYSRYWGELFVGYEEGTPHVCFPCIVFASLVLGFSVPSGRRSCCTLPLDCRVMLTLPASSAQPSSSNYCKLL